MPSKFFLVSVVRSTCDSIESWCKQRMIIACRVGQSSNCSQCQAGTSSVSGSAQCRPCDSGQFSGPGTSFSCQNCNAGTFACVLYPSDPAASILNVVIVIWTGLQTVRLVRVVLKGHRRQTLRPDALYALLGDFHRSLAPSVSVAMQAFLRMSTSR